MESCDIPSTYVKKRNSLMRHSASKLLNKYKQCPSIHQKSEREKIDIPNTQVHGRPRFWLDADTSIKGVGVKLVLGAKPLVNCGSFLCSYCGLLLEVCSQSDKL